MADYYPLIAKAVASLPQSTLETRSAIYERARTALITQLNKLDPPVPSEVIDREEKSLASAVARLEAELGAAPETSPPPALVEAEPTSPQAGNSSPNPEERSSVTAAEAVSPEEKIGEVEKTFEPSKPQAPQLPKLFGSSFGASSASESLQIDPSREPALAIPSSIVPPLKLPKLGSTVELAEVEAPTNQAPPLPSPVISKPIDDEPQASQEGLSRPALPLPEIPPRADIQRPFAPQPKAEPGPPKRLWILGFVLAIVVSLVAAAAWHLRDRPETLLRPARVAAPAPIEPSPRGKISDRLEGGQTPDVQSPQTVSGSDSKITPAESQTPTANAPVETSPAATGALAANDLTLAQHRAALLVEAPDEPGKVKTMTGVVEWRLDNVANGPDQPVSAAVHAEIDIPEAKFQASMSFQKNFDPSLPASHTIKITFSQAPGSTVSAVQQISLPQMRRQDAATGETLNGVPVPIMENSFLIGLSRGTAEPSNLGLIQSHEWMDFPMLLVNGRIAKLTFEKGPQGSSAIDDAIASWAAQP